MTYVASSVTGLGIDCDRGLNYQQQQTVLINSLHFKVIIAEHIIGYILCKLRMVLCSEKNP